MRYPGYVAPVAIVQLAQHGSKGMSARHLAQTLAITEVDAIGGLRRLVRSGHAVKKGNRWYATELGLRVVRETAPTPEDVSAT